MIFPSLFAQVETGLLSQFSVWAVLIFSYFINKWKKIFIILCVPVATFLIINVSKAALAAPGRCGSSCMNSMQYYGTPYGQNPIYLYGGVMPYHSMMGVRPYYFSPYGPSPYQPANCVQCMMRYQQYTNPIYGGGPLTQIVIPFKNRTFL